MATVELAACLPVLVLLVSAVLGAVAVVSAHVRAEDAAREAARAVARGDPAAAARLVRQTAAGARLSTSSGGADVTATVTTSVHPLGGLLPSFTVTERAVAAREPASTPAGAR